MPRLNTHLPDSYGLSLTVYVPTASNANPVNTGDVLVWDDTTGWGAAPAGEGAAVELVAKHPVSDPSTPLGVYVYGYSRTQEFRYTGDIALGDSIVFNGDGTVRAAGADVTNGTRVAYIENGIVSVLLP